MFTAIVLACVIGRPDACMKFTDNRGPYLQEEVCKARAYEMAEAVVPTLPPMPFQFFFKCETGDETPT